MFRWAPQVAAVLVASFLLAGCGGSGHDPATTTHPVSAVACGEVVLDVRFISQLISNNVEAMANSLHPKELARRTGTAQQSLLVAVRLVKRFHAPPSLARARAQLIDGLQRYAYDFGQARQSVLKNDMATASQQLADQSALAEVRKGTKTINRICGT